MGILKAFALMALVASAVVLGAASNHSSHAAVPIVSLCSLSENPKQFQGRKVRLTGVFRSGEYGAFLLSPACEARPMILQAPWGKKQWRNFPDPIANDSDPRRQSLVVELEGVFVYRTDIRVEERNPFLFCGQIVRSAIRLDLEILDKSRYEVYQLRHGPVPPLDRIPCPLPDFE